MHQFSPFAAVILAATIAIPAAAQRSSYPASAVPELHAFQLNESMLQKFKTASNAMDAYLATHPQEVMPDMADDPGKIVAQLNRQPFAVSALSHAGISARDCADSAFVILAAIMFMPAEKAGKPLPDYISRENFDFVRSHLTEIQSIQMNWTGLT